MSAEVLRAAARLMRERAEAAQDWTVDDDNHLAIPFLTWNATEPPKNRSLLLTEYEITAYDDATTYHLGAWHPSVALAIADWLTAEADDHDLRVSSVNAIAEEQGWDHHVDTVWIDSAPLAVARAYLGESA